MGRLGVKRDWIEKIDRATRDYSPEDLITTGTSLDAATASAVLDLALRVSELALRVGASASGATAFALTVTRTYGLNVDIDVTWGSITISYQRTGVWEPVTGFRSVRDRYRDYQALGRLTGFVDDVAAGKFTLAEAREKFLVIRRAGRPYRRWLRAVAYGVFGMTVATMLGGYGVETWLSGISMVLLFGVKRSLARLGVAPFFQHVAGAAIPTSIALFAMFISTNTEYFKDISPALIVVAGMVDLLAGLDIVTAARDAMEGNLLTAAASSFDATVKTGGIVFGALVTLWIGQVIGISASISPAGSYVDPGPWQIGLAAVGSTVFALLCHVRPKSLLVCGLLGGVGYGTYYLLTHVIESNLSYYPIVAGISAFAVGMVAELFSRRWRTPLVALVTAGVVSLVPGMLLYRGLFLIIHKTDRLSAMSAAGLLWDTALTGFALAAGSMLGAHLMRPFSSSRQGWRLSVIND